MSEYVSFCMPLQINGVEIAQDVEGRARIVTSFPTHWEIELYGCDDNGQTTVSLDDPVGDLKMGLRSAVIDHLLRCRGDDVDDALRSYYRGQRSYGREMAVEIRRAG